MNYLDRANCLPSMNSFERLNSLKKDVLCAWENQVKKQRPKELKQNKVLLIDSMPEFIEQIVSALKQMSTHTRFIEPSLQVKKCALKYAEDRANLGNYLVGQVVLEYQILREILFEFLNDGHSNLTSKEHTMISTLIDQAIREVVHEFEKIQMSNRNFQLSCLDRILSITEDYIFLVDHPMNITYANQAFLRFVNKTFDQILGKKFNKLPLPIDYINKVEEAMLTFSKTHNTGITEIYFSLNTGRKCHLMTLTLIESQYPLLGKIAILGKEITEQKHYEDEREQFIALSQIDLKRLRLERETRERLMITLCHDLRIPLTVVKTSAQFMLRQNLEISEAHTRMLNRIEKSADRANQMLEDLLDTSRSQSGKKLILTFEQCNLEDLVKEVIEDLSLTYGNLTSGDRFVFKFGFSIDGIWNSQGIRRVIENLTNNAVKHGASDQPVTLFARQLKDRIYISVHNYGPPISLEAQKNIFVPFQRFESSSSAARGWGLGLTIVKAITEAHGGRIMIESLPEEGTTFTIDLPQNSIPFKEKLL